MLMSHITAANVRLRIAFSAASPFLAHCVPHFTFLSKKRFKSLPEMMLSSTISTWGLQTPSPTADTTTSSASLFTTSILSSTGESPTLAP